MPRSKTLLSKALLSRTLLSKALVSKTFGLLASLAIFLAASSPATAQESPVRVLATGVFASALESLRAPFEVARGTKIQITIGNAGEIAKRVTAGEPADLVMTSSAGIKALDKQNLLVPGEAVIGKMRLGVAVRSGAAKPDLSSADALKALLLSADKIAYIDPNGGGTAGPAFEKILVSLGVADAVRAKAILGKTGEEIVKAVASGAATIGMTQASEIVGRSGVDFAGYLPDAQNVTTVYSAGLAAKSSNPKAAADFLEFVTSPIGTDQFRRAGWDIER